jgi:hypothetical protein
MRISFQKLVVRAVAEQLLATLLILADVDKSELNEHSNISDLQ